MKTVYSESLNEMVVKGFYYKGGHYEWNDIDCVYYHDDIDGRFCYEVPTGAIID